MTELAQYNINLTPVRANELILKPVYSDPFFASDFQFYPNVPEGFTQKMMLMGEDIRPLRAKVGCGFAPTGGPSLAEKSLTTAKIGANKQLCADEFKNSLAVLALQLGLDAFDMTNTVLRAAAQQTWVRGVQKHINQLRWFSQKTIGDASMNMTDGYWNVLIPAAVNAGATHINNFSNVALGSGDGLDLVKTVYEGASLELKGLPAASKVMYISGAAYEQFLNDIEANIVNTTVYVQAIENGVGVVRYRGVEVRPAWEWDALALQYMGLTHANLVAYFAKGNLQWASDTSSVSYRSWYDEKDEQFYWKTYFQLGFGIAHESLLAVAY